MTSTLTWAPIDTIRDQLDQADYWSESFFASALDLAKNQHIRKSIKALTDENGWPLFASVITRDPETGSELRRYKQEALFDRDDYAHVVRFHRQRAIHHDQMADGYADHARVKFGMQLTLDAIAAEAVRM